MNAKAHKLKNGTVRFVVVIPDRLDKQIRMFASINRVQLSQIAQAALSEWVKKPGRDLLSSFEAGEALRNTGVAPAGPKK